MKQKSTSFSYPHPINKNLYQQGIYNDQNIQQIKQYPTLYNQNYKFDCQSLVSGKFLRLSKHKVIPQQKFGLLVQPFNENQQISQYYVSSQQLKQLKCSGCNAYYNVLSQTMSLYEIKCTICNKISILNSLAIKNSLQSIPVACDIIMRHNNQSITRQTQKVVRNICFVIQASEFNYSHKVDQIIKSCLDAIKLQNINQFQDENKIFGDQLTQDGSNNQIYQLRTETQVHYNIAFVMFNDRNVFIINQNTHDILNISTQFISQSDQHSEILPFSALFKPIDYVTAQTFQIVHDILYQSYTKTTSCINLVTNFLHKHLDNFYIDKDGINNLNQNKCDQKQEINFKFFINNLHNTKNLIEKTQVGQKGVQNDKNSILQNISNKISKTLQKVKQIRQQKQNNSSTKNNLFFHPNFSFFYLPHNKQVISHCKQAVYKLKQNLIKIYQPLSINQKNTTKANARFNSIYYDIFQNLTKISYFDVKVKIVTSQRVQVVNVGNGQLGVLDSTQIIKSKTIKGNQFQFSTHFLSSNTTIPIDLKIIPSAANKKNDNADTSHFIQVQLSYKKQVIQSSNKIRIQNECRVFQTCVQCFQRVSPNCPFLTTLIDDQMLFYFLLREIYIECHLNKTIHTIKSKLHQKIQQIADYFKDSYGSINLPKQYRHLFLYSFMIENSVLANGLDQTFNYHRLRLITRSMECFAKTIYPRTYQIIQLNHSSNNQVYLKNIKSTGNHFKSNGIYLLENGSNLFMVIGENNSVQTLKNIFGVWDMRQITQLAELPELLTNISYRQCIQYARKLHQSNFLPLKIMNLFSNQFQTEIGHLLYKKQSHYQYMRELGDLQPNPKSTKKRR